MKKQLLSLLLLTTCFGASVHAQVPWIIGGASATENEFPWVGNIHYNSTHYCGTSLINTQWAITAGHCLAEQSAFPQTKLVDTAKMLIRFNTISTSGAINPNGGVSRKVKKIFMHPSFDLQHFESGYDLGLIMLAEPITTITPIPLPNIADTATLYAGGTPVRMAGWGLKDTFSNTAPDTLKWCNSQIYDMALCNTKAQATFGFPVSSDRFCAGYTSSQTQAGSASGDSGGPIWKEDAMGKVILGVVSGGFASTTLADQPGLFTKIAVYRKWIDSIMNAQQPTAIKNVSWSDDEIKVGTAPNAINLYFKDLGTTSVQVALYSFDGKVVYDTEVMHPSFQTYTINNAGLAKGMYVLRIYNNESGRYFTKKLVNAGL